MSSTKKLLQKPVICSIFRQFHTYTPRFKKVAPNNLKGKSVSSQHWLMRQMKDPYVEKAKFMNYRWFYSSVLLSRILNFFVSYHRCRSAFKLIEIDDRFKILSPGQTVVDCGAAPGSWTQVAIQRVNADGHDETQPKGTVIAIDRLQLYPIEHAQLFTNMDFTLLENQKKIREHLNNNLVDVVVSDMAPKASGIKYLDQDNIITLCYSAFRFALQMSRKESTLLMKMWQGTGVKKLEEDLSKFYESVRAVKPESSRSDSAEMFLLARGFKGVNK